MQVAILLRQRFDGIPHLTTLAYTALVAMLVA
jgi:hypothetical protein